MAVVSYHANYPIMITHCHVTNGLLGVIHMQMCL